MELEATPIDIGTRTPTVLLNAADAAELGVHPLDRVVLAHDGRTETGLVQVTDGLIDPGTVGVAVPLAHVTGSVEVTLAPKPDSVEYVRKKLRDVELDDTELAAVVNDIERDRLSDVELSAFVTGLFTNGLSRAEIEHLTEAMVAAGEQIEWDASVVADKHSIGGVAGNRVTPVVVPIVAAAGLRIPKTSSRAVTSAAGTADTMEVFCDVEFSVAEIRAIVAETGGCMVWGGGVNLSPVDDKVIRVETPLSIDPPGQVVASVLSKKKSAGATHVVIDVPYGESAKVPSLDAARAMAEDFDRVGETLGMSVECAITRGDQPIGRGIGPVLEARDVLAVLDGGGPPALRTKSLRLAAMLFEACGVDADPAAILDDGRAMATFRSIVAAQDGDPDVTRADLTPGNHTAVVRSPRDGVVTHLDNELLNETARRAGAPRDHGAGVETAVGVGDAVDDGDDLFTIHAERAAKLTRAERFARRRTPARVAGPDEALVEQYQRTTNER